MMTYNYRLMHTDEMRRAVEACVKAGIGLTAMKTQGGGQVLTGGPEEIRIGGRFVQGGFTEGQAKLKAVWENPQIASHLLPDADHGALAREHRGGRRTARDYPPWSGTSCSPMARGRRGGLLRGLHAHSASRRSSQPCRSGGSCAT